MNANRELGSLAADHAADSEYEPGIQEASIEIGRLVLHDAVRACRQTFDSRFIAAYALGSLAHGGFSAAVSDVDLGLVLADPILPSDGDALVNLTRAVRASGTALHQRLSVFWGTPSALRSDATAGRFPPLDRLCLIDHGQLLDGHDVRKDFVRPDTDALIAAGAEFALEYLGTDQVIAQVRQPELVLAGGVRWFTKMVLFPVRFLFTAQSGAEGTNEAAAAHYLAYAKAPGAALVAAALAARSTGRLDEPAIAKLLDNQLLPLYLGYIDDHTSRLGRLGHPRLVEAFGSWRENLVR